MVTNAVIQPTAKEGASLSARKSKRVAVGVVVLLMPILFLGLYFSRNIVWLLDCCKRAEFVLLVF